MDDCSTADDHPPPGNDAPHSTIHNQGNQSSNLKTTALSQPTQWHCAFNMNKRFRLTHAIKYMRKAKLDTLFIPEPFSYNNSDSFHKRMQHIIKKADRRGYTVYAQERSLLLA